MTDMTEAERVRLVAGLRRYGSDEHRYKGLTPEMAVRAADLLAGSADPSGVVAEIIADYGDDLTDAGNRVEAINRIVSALTAGAEQ